MSTVYQGGASIDERGKASGGKAGNQTRAELRKRKWYIHSKGWYILRAKDLKVRKAIAKYMRRAVPNLNIGYDQGQRYTLYNLVKSKGYDPGEADKLCECDCSTLIATIIQAAFLECGIDIEIPIDGFRTSNEVSRLMATGQFELLTSDMYCKNRNGDYLCEGDVAVTTKQGHTVAIWNNGAKASAGSTGKETDPTPIVQKGDKNESVKTVQTLLRKWDLRALSADGVDSIFGPDTEKWVKKFQKAHALEVDGIVGPKTWKMLGAYAVTDLGGEDDGKDEEAPDEPIIPLNPKDRPTLSKGDSGPWVEILQTVLKDWKEEALPAHGIDSDFGRETLDWVVKFQKAKKLSADGVVGPKTWAELIKMGV